METKKEIRRRIRTKRRDMPEELWRKNSRAVTETIVSHPWFLGAKDIYTYVAYDREVRTQEIIDAAFEMGKNVWVPRVAGETMQFFRIRSMEELRPGAYGILEPVRNERDEWNEQNGGKESLMIMPGVAFDETCRRIGYGGGYYDRYLARHSMLRTIALAFEFQVFQEIPCEAYDICPDILLTEKRTLCKKQGFKGGLYENGITQRSDTLDECR